VKACRRLAVAFWRYAEHRDMPAAYFVAEVVHGALRRLLPRVFR